MNRTHDLGGNQLATFVAGKQAMRLGVEVAGPLALEGQEGPQAVVHAAGAQVGFGAAKPASSSSGR